MAALLAAGALGTPVPALAVTNPVAHWKLDDGAGGTANDEIGTADGTVSGPTWLTSGAAVGTGALRFDGVNDKVTVAASSAIEPIELTVTVWVRGDPNDPPAAGEVILEKGAFNCEGPSYGLYVTATGLKMSFRSPNGFQVTQSVVDDDQNVNLWDGAWHLVSMYANVPVEATWVDGSLTMDGHPTFVGSGTSGDFLNTGQHTTAVRYAGATATGLTIGGPTSSGCGAGFFDGDIDDVRIYSDPAFAYATLMPTVSTAMTGLSNLTVNPGQLYGDTVNISPTPRWGDAAFQLFTGGVWTNVSSNPIGDDGNAAVGGNAPVAAGSYPIRANFAAGLPYLDSTQSATLTVDPWPTTTTVSFSLDPFLPNENVLLNAYVDSTWMASSQHPVGSVKFWDTTGVSPVLLGTQTVDQTASPGDSRASMYVGTLSIGTHQITAEYVGPDPARSGSSSSEKDLVVTKFSPTILLSDDQSGQVEANSPFQLHAGVLNAGSNYASGATMTFTRVGTVTPICTVPVVDQGSTTCTVPGQPVGSWQFTATYSGNAEVAEATSNTVNMNVATDILHATGVGLEYTTFYPYKDSYRDTVAIRGTRGEPISVVIKIYKPTGTLVKTVTIAQGTGAYSSAWNGRNSAGTIYAEGKYKVVQTLKDAAGTTQAFTSYVTLSKKKASVHVTTITKLGSAYVAKGSSGSGTVVRNTTSGYAKLSSPNDGFSYAITGWELTLPSASIYELFYVKVYGRRPSGSGFNQFGAQNFKTCAYSATADWNADCFAAWTIIPATSGTTLQTYRSANLSSAYRSGRKVRITVLTTGGTIYIYKAQVAVRYVILTY